MELCSLRSVIHLARTTRSCYNSNQQACSGIPERANYRSFRCEEILISMFNGIQWTKEGATETCLHTAKAVAASLVLLGAASDKYVVERKFQRTSRKIGIVSHCKWLTHSSVILPTRYCQRQPLSIGQLRNGGRNYHFQGTVDSKTILIKTFLARCLFGICNRIFQLYET